jgi:hypothetical protein
LETGVWLHANGTVIRTAAAASNLAVEARESGLIIYSFLRRRK